MPSATTSAGSASTRHKPGVFPPAIVSIRRFGYKHLLRSVGTASSIHTGARSALTCCFPKGSVHSSCWKPKWRCIVNTMKQKTDVLQGTLALMVLKTLDVLGPLHGYGIARRIEQIS